MVRWLILSAVCAAGAAHAQTGSVKPAPSQPAADGQAARVSTPNVTTPGVTTPGAATPGAATREGSGLTPTGAPGLGMRTAPRLEVYRLNDDEMPAFLESDRLDGDVNTDVTLTGNAQVRRQDSVLKGDVINYKKGAADLTAVGNARMMRDATLVTGSGLRYNFDREAGEIESPTFFLPSGGRAVASQADLYSRATMRLNDVTYSGCACDEPAWYIKSSEVDLDFDENEGVATNGVLYFKHVPILASPYLTFPIKKERKSGFLLPTYGTSSRSGFEFTLPYYLNLAPNYDATITPRYFTKRGPQLGGEFRYLGESYSGMLSGTYMSSDDMTGANRWLISSRHRQLLGNGFYADWDFNRVSDDDYFRDFSTFGLNEATTVNLPQRGRVGWSDRYWQSYAEVYKYQTLQDVDAFVSPPYDKKPEFGLIGERYDYNGFDLRMASTATRFSQPRVDLPQFESTDGRLQGQRGDRLVAYPTIAYPMVGSSAYLTPKIGLHHTKYQSTRWFQNPQGFTQQQIDDGIYRRNRSRTLPIASLDAGMTFERDTSLFGKSSLQTLEPRLYYLNVPYRDQTALPVYDTSIADFGFGQIFQENTYSGGWDRIANANQLTAGLTTRWLDADSGFERLSLSVAQRFYFERQKVTLPGEVKRGKGKSDYLASAGAALTDTLSTEIAGQYDPYGRNLDRALASLRWSPQRLTTVSLAYRYQRQPQPITSYSVAGQNQVSLAFQWPFTDRWSGIGRFDYSIGERRQRTVVSDQENRRSSRFTQSIAGVEYKGDCCWIGRVVFQRYAVSAADTNTAVFFQLELSGLGALGTDPMSLLSRSVPGYQSVTPPTPTATAFERYE